MKYQKEKVGRRIAERRKHLHLKQNELAEMLEISNNHLSGIERGRSSLRMELFMKICAVLCVTPDQLLLGAMQRSSSPQNIIDGLRLCSEDDRELAADIITVLVDHATKRAQGKSNSNTRL